MKKSFSTLLLMALLAFSGFAVATPVLPSTAIKAARTLLSALGEDSKAPILAMESPFDDLIFLSVDNNRGFVILAADDNSEAILGFSLDNSISFNDMPDNLRAWLEGYAGLVRYNRLHPDLPSSHQAREKWVRLSKGDLNAFNRDNTKASIPTKLQTTWNQSPYYNKFCPFDSAAGKLSVSGCTAVATAQIMKYFNHPAEGYGQGSYIHKNFGPITCNYGTYHWNSMPNFLNGSSSDSAIDAVATLIYHCGVAVHMNYNASGSGGKTASYGYGGDAASENALKYNFKYSPYIWTAFCCDYSDSELKNLVLNELENDRPVLYAGYDEVQSGHAFVIDGYKSMNGSFHINWGWGGSADGFFLITGLNPGGYNFNLFATATIGITPFDGFDMQGTTTVNLSTEGIRGASASDGTVTGSGTYNFGDTITMTATATHDNVRFVQWNDGCRYNPRSTVATGGEINFTAQFAPLQCSDTIGFFTTGNAMNRAANIPEGLATDSVWGIKIPASAIKEGSQLHAIRIHGRKKATHHLTIYSGEQSPEEVLYEDSFFDSLDYEFTFHTHHLSSPLLLDGSKSLWIKLKCTEVDTPAVFSIYGGNPNGMLVGDNLEPRNDWKFSWMIEAIFSGNVGIESGNATQRHNVAVYPNPANSKVTVATDGISHDARLTITDILGKELKVIASPLPNPLQIDVSTFTEGIYFIKLQSEGNTSIKKLIIKR